MINRALKEIRRFHGLSLHASSLKLGISVSHLSLMENGKRSISYSVLEKYSDVFDMPVSSLIFFSENIDKSGTVPEKFRVLVAGKILRIMEWMGDRLE